MSYNPLTAVSQMCDDLIASGAHSERAETSSEHRQHTHVSSNQFDLARTSGDRQRTCVQAGHVSSAQRQLKPERSTSSYGQGNHPEASDKKLELVIRKRQEKVIFYFLFLSDVLLYSLNRSLLNNARLLIG